MLDTCKYISIVFNDSLPTGDQKPTTKRGHGGKVTSFLYSVPSKHCYTISFPSKKIIVDSLFYWHCKDIRGRCCLF